MDLAAVTTMLARTPTVLQALLDGVDQLWVRRDDGPGTWSAYDIVGHLLHADETDWVPRARMILRWGASRPFEQFDREAMLGRAPEPVDVLLERFRTARTESLAELSTMELSAGDLDRHGLHPDLGEVTLGQLLATWVAHDLAHLGQIGEVLARRYRDEVGPWRAYLPALERAVDAE